MLRGLEESRQEISRNELLQLCRESAPPNLDKGSRLRGLRFKLFGKTQARSWAGLGNRSVRSKAAECHRYVSLVRFVRVSSKTQHQRQKKYSSTAAVQNVLYHSPVPDSGFVLVATGVPGIEKTVPVYMPFKCSSIKSTYRPLLIIQLLHYRNVASCHVLM